MQQLSLWNENFLEIDVIVRLQDQLVPEELSQYAMPLQVYMGKV